jgi:ATP-dependent DNA helicase RecQ
VAADPGDATERVRELLDRARLVAEARAERIVSFAESPRCRHQQVAEHFGETLAAPCGRCDVCAPRQDGSRARRAAAGPLPDDVAEAIVDAVAALTWPLGRRSLVATLRGSLRAPPSARRSAAFGLLAAASESEVARWVQALERSGALLEVTSEEGYRLLTADRSAPRPLLGPVAADRADEAVVARLREWRRERSRADGVPAYVVLHDATLRELAAAGPRSHGELAGVKGLGPAKLDRYGEELLQLLAP